MAQWCEAVAEALWKCLLTVEEVSFRRFMMNWHGCSRPAGREGETAKASCETVRFWYQHDKTLSQLRSRHDTHSTTHASRQYLDRRHPQHFGSVRFLSFPPAHTRRQRQSVHPQHTHILPACLFRPLTLSVHILTHAASPRHRPPTPLPAAALAAVQAASLSLDYVAVLRASVPAGWRASAATATRADGHRLH